MYSKIVLYSLFRQPEFHLTFILSKKRFLVWYFTEPSSPSMEEFCLDIEFEISKDLSLLKLQKHTKKCRFQEQLQV